MSIIEIANLQDHYEINRGKVKKTVKKILDKEAQNAELSIVFVDNDRIKELNERYLGHDEVTDVITFPLDSSEKQINGEIIVSVERALEVARQKNLNVEAEIILYVVHGILHLSGYDDGDRENAITMHKKESQLLDFAGYNMPVVEVE